MVIWNPHFSMHFKLLPNGSSIGHFPHLLSMSPTSLNIDYFCGYYSNHVILPYWKIREIFFITLICELWAVCNFSMSHFETQDAAQELK